MHPDSKKVQGIVDMTPLTNKQQLQSFLGMVNYMGGWFIPNLPHHTATKSNAQKNAFHWDQQVNQSFQQIKALILKANDSLTYYEALQHVSYSSTMEKTNPLSSQARTSWMWRPGMPTQGSHFSRLTKFPDFSSIFLMFCFLTQNLIHFIKKCSSFKYH